MRGFVLLYLPYVKPNMWIALGLYLSFFEFYKALEGGVKKVADIKNDPN